MIDIELAKSYNISKLYSGGGLLGELASKRAQDSLHKCISERDDLLLHVINGL